jgi:Uma2 family endonuclease
VQAERPCVGLLSDWNKQYDHGTVFPQDSSYLLMVDGDVCVRKPDVSFIRKENYTAEDEQADGHISIVPDLVAEVVSPGDLFIDTDRKVEAYLKAGVQLVWIVRPERRMVEVNRANGTVTSLRAEDVLSGEAVLPGFECQVASLFEAKK